MPQRHSKLENGWINPQGRFIKIEYVHAEIVTDKDLREFERSDPELRALGEARHDPDEEDESGTVAQRYDEFIAQNYIERGWVRVQQHGFDGLPNSLLRQRSAIEEQVSKYLDPDDLITFDVKMPTGYTTFDITAAEFYEGEMPHAMRSAMMQYRMTHRRSVDRREKQVFVRSHGRKVGVYPEGRYYRERVMEPSACQPGSMRTIDIGREGGHKAVVCRPRGSRKTRTQSILHPRTERERRKLGLPKRTRRAR